MSSSSSNKQQIKYLCSFLLLVGLVSCIIIGESMAGNKGEDIILYNGNIVLRGKKGKGGSIVVANSPQMDAGPFMDFGMFGRKK